MNKDNRIEVLKRLDKKYGKKPICYLNYKKDYELLIATILSAQCTDAMVNEVTEKLFKKYKSINEFANADVEKLSKEIIKTGYYRNKAKHVIECMKKLRDNYNSKVPSEIDELVELPGVGRKTANVIRIHLYHMDCIVVDTHVKRVSKLLGFTKEIDPTKVEYDLMKKLSKENWARINGQLMALGRTYCNAMRKDCIGCYLNDICDTGKKEKNNEKINLKKNEKNILKKNITKKLKKSKVK